MIYTSYYSNIKGVLGKKPNICFCRISGYAPDWFVEYDKKIDLKSIVCRSLAPKKDWWQVWHNKFKDNLESEESKAWYTKRYEETVLSKLDAKNLISKLYELSDSRDICMLCFETPNKFCHRHLVAKWLNDNGIACTEI